MKNNHKHTMVRRGFFFTLLAIVLSIYSAVDYFDLADECLTMYSLELAISLLCGFIYMWWWHKSGGASDVFKWLTLLFFAQSARLVGNIIVRVDFLNHVDSMSYRGFVTDSYLWTFRNFPELLVLLFMLSLIMGRLWCNVPAHKCLGEE